MAYLVSYDLNKYPRGEPVPRSDYKYIEDFIAHTYTKIETDIALTTTIIIQADKSRAAVKEEILSHLAKRRFTAASIDLLVVGIYAFLPRRRMIDRVGLNSV